MNTVGELLKEYRGNLSLREAAALTGISHAHIRNFELGYNSRTLKPMIPSPDLLKTFANAYRCDYMELMDAAGYLNTENKSIDKKSKEYQISAFRDRFKKLRNKKGLSYSDLSVASRISTDILEEFETEDCEYPTIETLYALSYALDCTPDYLGGYTDLTRGISPDTPRPQELMDFLREQAVMYNGIPLTPEDKQQIDEILKAVFIKAKRRKSKKQKKEDD